MVHFALYDSIYFWLGIVFSFLMIYSHSRIYISICKEEHGDLITYDFFMLVTVLLNLVIILSYNMLTKQYEKFDFLVNHKIIINIFYFLLLIYNMIVYYINSKLSAYYAYENMLKQKKSENQPLLNKL